VHVERLEQHVRLVAHALLQTLELSPIKIISQDRSVIGVRAVLDDNTGTLTRRQSTNISKTLLSNDDIEIVLGLIDVRGEGHDARDTGGIGLGGPGTGSVHDTVLGVAEEIGRTAETVQHARAHDTGAVGVRVDVHFNGGVHADAAEATDDLGGVGDLLRAQEELAGVALPVVVEALEAVRREADGGCGGEVQVAAVEEVQEGILQDFGPHLQVLEVGAALAEAADDGVGDVADAGLDGEQVGRETAVLHLVLEELDQVRGDRLRALVFGGVGQGDVRGGGLDDGDDLLGVNGDVACSNAVLGAHDEVGLASGGQIGAGDIVQTLEGRHGGVDFDDDLVGHLDQLGRGTHGGTGDNAAILSDGGSLDDGDVDVGGGLVQSVPALNTKAVRLARVDLFSWRMPRLT
jgi:hypothetical protein